ncbi:MAG TPA: D-alanine--poly(phosphoribitol) ligase subunit 2 [Lactobacillus sp.]|nr:D-alanine--poly(phosphoribitol) ligase subunit 2 [Lactobacillus sp.]
MDVKETVISILNDLTGDDVSSAMDTNLFDSGLMDSMGSVQLLLELQSQLGVNVPVSEFVRSEWDTPNKIVTKVEGLVD